MCCVKICIQSYPRTATGRRRAREAPFSLQRIVAPRRVGAVEPDWGQELGVIIHSHATEVKARPPYGRPIRGERYAGMELRWSSPIRSPHIVLVVAQAKTGGRDTHSPSKTTPREEYRFLAA